MTNLNNLVAYFSINASQILNSVLENRLSEYTVYSKLHHFVFSVVFLCFTLSLYFKIIIIKNAIKVQHESKIAQNLNPKCPTKPNSSQV